MRVIDRYLLHDYLVTFLVTVLVFTFVMCVGAIIRAVDLIARGVDVTVILWAFTYNIPYILTFSIPMSCMTTVLLLFGRLSLDGEITAMRASGLSMWQIISPIIFLCIFLTGFCIYLNVSLAPNAHFARRQALVNVGVEAPINLIEEGRFVRLVPGLMIYIGKKDRNEIRDIVVYEVDDAGVSRSIRAQSGTVSMPEEFTMLVDLYDVRIDQPDPDNPDESSSVRTIHAGHYPVTLDFSQLFRRDSISKTKSSMTLQELIHAIRNVREIYPNLEGADLQRARMGYLVEANERLALSFSCFAFALLGIPLGMKSKRRESSVGIGISLGVVFLFYFFIIIADALVRHPHLRPDLIVWFPVIAGELVGFYLIKKHN